uniref:Uncharacterized protein n=1 Tax=Leersia perrieri TaxID=77586 RepID=A0A0D9VD00_9ORYZ
MQVEELSLSENETESLRLMNWLRSEFIATIGPEYQGSIWFESVKMPRCPQSNVDGTDQLV